VSETLSGSLYGGGARSSRHIAKSNADTATLRGILFPAFIKALVASEMNK
jgi:hypothetical protein